MSSSFPAPWGRDRPTPTRRTTQLAFDRSSRVPSCTAGHPPGELARLAGTSHERVLRITELGILSPGRRSSGPDVSEREPFWEGVGLVEQVLGGPGEPGLTAEGGYYRRKVTYGRLLDQPADEPGAEDPLVHEIRVHAEFTLRVQDRHGGTRPGPAGGAVDRARPSLGAAPVERSGRDDDGVLPAGLQIASGLPQLGDRDALDRRVLGMRDGELFAGRGLDHLSDAGDAAPFLRSYTHPDLPRVRDDVEHAAPGDVHGEPPEFGHVHRRVQVNGEGRDVAERHTRDLAVRDVRRDADQARGC